jgi:hypothetical protein
MSFWPIDNTVQEIYTQVISPLPPTERLQLASLIRNNLVHQDSTIVEVSDTWTEQDQLDVVAFSLKDATDAFPEEEEIWASIICHKRKYWTQLEQT